MPPKSAREAVVRANRDRFRSVVDPLFNGHLSNAARVLGLPFSTVQAYYQHGPRRMSRDFVATLEVAERWRDEHLVKLRRLDWEADYSARKRAVLLSALASEVRRG